MTVPATAALTAAEQGRIRALRAAVTAEIGLQRHYPIGDALQTDGALSPAQAFLTNTEIFTAWLAPGGLEAWLQRQPSAARRAAGKLRLGHLLPGNHPGAVVSALLPGWLLGCAQIARPSARLRGFTTALVAQVQTALGATLAATPPPCEIREWDSAAATGDETLRALLADCEVVTAQGSDFTVERIEAAWAALPVKRRPRLIGLGSRMSLLAVDCTEPLTPRSAEDIAYQLIAADQRGCLSPHGVMLVGSARGRGAALEAIAAALGDLDFEAATWTAEEHLAAGYQHRVYGELARRKTAGFAVQEVYANGGRAGEAPVVARLWSVPLAEPPLALTVRSVYVWQAATAAAAAKAISGWQIPLQAVGCHPGTERFQKTFATLGAWVTDAGHLGCPPVDWPQDGCDLLTRIVRSP